MTASMTSEKKEPMTSSSNEGTGAAGLVVPGSPAGGPPETLKLLADGVTHYFTPVKAKVPLLALDSIDLYIPAGHFVAVVGPSGCGKSTLLRMFAGLIRPTRGTVFLDGKPITGPDSRKGMAFQEDAVFPWLSVEGNVRYGLRCRGVPKKDAREIARRWIAAVGLDGFEQSYPHELSGGMRKRVDLARLYASDSEVLLMDEPFGALDAMTKQDLQEDLLRLWQGAVRTVVFVTHDLEEAIYLADIVVFMSARPGRIKDIRSVKLDRPRPADVRDSPEFFELVRSSREVLGER